ncbi:DUF2927 domain-containing protein [Roseobacteraceae bacterium NS-SX3]
MDLTRAYAFDAAGTPRRRGRGAVLLAGLLALAACSAATGTAPPDRARIAATTLPPPKAFALPRPAPPQRANTDIARDFLDLHFKLESGTELPVFTRFEAPITLRVTGKPAAGLQQGLAALLSRLRREAGIPVRQVSGGPARITVEAVPRAEIRRTLPKAACFVVPNVSSLKEYRRNRRNPATGWARLRSREKLAVFVPSDVSPQEMRDCLHEELAQAIGPLNDLYRLPDSVFNDDNVHTVLTGFDMLILRATYAPELRTGMTRAQVAARLPAILARLNPAGEARRPQPLPETPRAWIGAVEAALGPSTGTAQRRQAAARAAAIAEQLGWQDHRRAFSHFILGRLLQASDPLLAQRHFQTALHFLARQPGTELHRALVHTRMAAFEIARGNGAGALALTGPARKAAAAHENAALLSTLMLLEAEALALEGRHEEARAVRLDSLGWARYGFGPEWAVRAKMQEVASLRPRNPATQQ